MFVEPQIFIFNVMCEGVECYETRYRAILLIKNPLPSEVDLIKTINFIKTIRVFNEIKKIQYNIIMDSYLSYEDRIKSYERDFGIIVNKPSLTLEDFIEGELHDMSNSSEFLRYILDELEFLFDITEIKLFEEMFFDSEY